VAGEATLSPVVLLSDGFTKERLPTATSILHVANGSGSGLPLSADISTLTVSRATNILLGTSSRGTDLHGGQHAEYSSVSAVTFGSRPVRKDGGKVPADDTRQCWNSPPARQRWGSGTANTRFFFLASLQPTLIGRMGAELFHPSACIGSRWTSARCSGRS
jgi:hypothetical protein